jgi:hypothetical protein
MNKESSDQKPPPKLSEFLISSVLVLGLAVLFFCGVVWCIKGLWNNVMPEIFGFKTLTYFQAMEFSLLIHLLLGSNSLWKSKK